MKDVKIAMTCKNAREPSIETRRARRRETRRKSRRGKCNIRDSIENPKEAM